MNALKLRLALVAAALLLVSLASVFELFRLVENVQEETRSSIRRVISIADAAKEAELYFSAQMQAWTDMMLRSDTPDQYGLHRDAFIESGNRVRFELINAVSALKSMGEDSGELAAIRKEHERLTRLYFESLSRFDPAAGLENILAMDRHLMGADRTLAQRMHRFSTQLESDEPTRLVAGLGLEAPPAEFREQLLLGLLLLLVPMAGIWGTYRIYRLATENEHKAAQIEAALDSLKEAVVKVDGAGCIQAMNRAAVNLSGRSEAAVLGEDFRAVWPVSDADSEGTLDRLLRQALAAGEALELPHAWLERPLGAPVSLECSVIPVLDDGGGAWVTLRDMGARFEVLSRLQDNELMLRATFEQAAVGIARVGLRGEWLEVNNRLCQITGYSREELLQLSFKDITHPDDLDRDLSLMAKLLGGALDSFQIEKRYLRKGGQPVWVALSVALVCDPDSKPDFFVSMVEDIQKRKDAISHIEKLYLQYMQLYEQMPDGVMLLDEQLRVVDCNNKCLEMYGYARQEVLEMTLSDFEQEGSAEEGAVRGQRLLEAGGADFESRHRNKRGLPLDVEVSIRPVKFVDGRNILQCVFRDLTEHKRAEQRIEYMAYHDPVTFLSNRRFFGEKVLQAVNLAARHQSQAALMVIDLDDFKFINDTYGHQHGDAMLLSVAQRLVAAVREDDEVARIGGDEFAVLLPDVGEASDVALVAHKIKEAIALPCVVGEASFHVSASIGISIYPQDGLDYATLLRHADTAMYQAKARGKTGYFFFEEELDQKAQVRMGTELDLRQALKRKEFELHYQPKVNMRNGKIIGAEALIRWHHPQRGMVSPLEFIHVAEQSGLINSIGEWVAYESCLQSRNWRDAGSPPMLSSFNVSARQIQHGDMISTLRQVVRDTGVVPGQVELELTESLLMNPKEVQSVLREIKSMGFKVALDDFGTGFSSLSYLCDMDIDVLKIDKSFVEGIAFREESREIARTIIDMARNMKMGVIAEGVETSAQVEILMSYGCDQCQGYLYGKPMPIAEFDNYLNRIAA